jgi:hypothetical protein
VMAASDVSTSANLPPTASRGFLGSMRVAKLLALPQSCARRKATATANQCLVNLATYQDVRVGPLLAVKAVHSLIWFGVEACMGQILYAGLKQHWDRRTAIAGAVVAGESLIFVGSGCRCPLTGVASRMGAAHAAVTDIFLPRWFAANLPAIHVPLVALAFWLHVRILMTRRRTCLR